MLPLTWLILTELIWLLKTLSSSNLHKPCVQKPYSPILLETKAPASTSPLIRVWSMPSFHPNPTPLGKLSRLSTYYCGTCLSPHITPRVLTVIPWANLPALSTRWSVHNFSSRDTQTHLGWLYSFLKCSCAAWASVAPPGKGLDHFNLKFTFSSRRDNSNPEADELFHLSS